MMAVDSATVTGDRRCVPSYPAPDPPVVPRCSDWETAAPLVLVSSWNGSWELIHFCVGPK